MKRQWFALAAVVLAWMVAMMLLLWVAGGWGPGVSHQAWAAAPEAEPTITGVDPSSAPNDLDASIVIIGAGFAPVPTITLGSTVLAEVGWVSSATLTATVPWGLDPGVYTMTAANPDGITATLPNAFTVTQGIGVWNAGELYGGSVEHLAINPLTPTTVYATSDLVGMFRSRDAAETWTAKYASIGMGCLAIDAVSPNRIYMEAFGHAGGNLFRSDDEGDTWTPLTTTFPATPPPADECWGGFGVYAHPSTPGTVYAHKCDTGVEDGTSGLIRSTNWGQDWEPAILGLTDTQVTALAFHPVEPDTMYLGTAGGNVYRSPNGGEGWTYASTPVGYVATLAVNPFGEHEIWVSSLNAFGDPCALLKSADADLTAWTALTPDPGQLVCAMSIDFAPTISGTAFIAGMQDYQTADGGTTWNPFGPPDVSIQDIALHPTDPDTIYVGDTNYGVHRTTDGGATWDMANEGLTAVVPRQLQTASNQPDIVYALVRGGDLYRGIRGGGAWQRLPISGTDSIVVDPVTPAHVYAGTYGFVYASTDSGDSWPTRGQLVPPPQYLACDQSVVSLLTVPGQPGTVLAGVHNWCGQVPSPGSIYRSTDFGANWDHVYPTATQEISQVNDLAYDPVSPTVIYAATGDDPEHDSDMLKSTDGGLNWRPVGAGEVDGALDVVVEPGTHRVFVSTGGLPLYVSDDGGETWTATGPGEGSNVYDILFAPGHPPVLYDAAYQGLYRSTDGAQSWQPAAGELGQATVYALAVVTATDRVILYAGTTGGYVESGQTSSELSGGTLIGAGVYRFTTLQRWWVHLPLVANYQ
jgi:photosystem II stability/assembly factor-like uncharacterized protein